MYDPHEYRRKRAELVAEIEASRTPEEKAWANGIRAQRAADDALPNHKKNEREEIQVFNAFAESPEADIDVTSGVNARSPEPDILCKIKGKPHYFELGEIVDQPVARCTAHSRKTNEVRGTAFSQDKPFEEIISKKRIRHYVTNGVPVDLLLYYRTQGPPVDWHFDMMLSDSDADLKDLVSGGRFQRVWIFDFAKTRVLRRWPA